MMNMERLIVYGLAVLFVIIGLFKRSNSLRARKISGNVVVGDSSGVINQSYRATETGSARPAEPDRIAWVIAIIGVLIAATQLAHDLLAK
jgi:hypothetical protein